MTSLVLVGIYQVNVSAEEMRFVTDEVTQDESLTDHELERLTLLEVLVSEASPGFDVGLLQQEGSDQAPWLERYFSADGQQYLGEQCPSLPEFRVCFFMHFFLPGVALQSPYGNVASTPITAMPARLEHVCKYEHPG